jgi:hypothetical protein
MSLVVRLRSFGLAPTPDPDESWQHLRPLLRDHRTSLHHRVRRRGLRGAVGAAVAVVLLSGAALGAQPVGRLLVGSWVEAWKGLARLAGADLDGDRAGPANGTEARDGGRSPAAPTGVRNPGGARNDDPASPLDDGGRTGDLDRLTAVARNDTSQTLEDIPVTVRVMRNDEAPRRDLRVQAAEAAYGTVSSNRDGTVTYTPGANFTGVDSFAYRVSDGTSWSGWADVAVTVTPVNDAPRAAGDRAMVDEDGSVVIEVLDNDQDVDDDVLTVLPRSPASGTVEVNGDGTVTYQPSADFNGDDTFSYRLSDGKSEPAVARIEVRVRPVNDAPEARDNEAITTVGAPVMIDVLTDDVDVDGDPLAVTTAQASHGTVAINQDGSLTYTPNPGYTGLDEIAYEISDGAGETARARVMVRVVTPPPGQTGNESSGGG